MSNILKLYKETSNLGATKKAPFPGEGDNWAYIADYKYSATRMSSAPSITTTLKWPRCLDEEWSTNVFVEYNGERYFVKNTPSSSYDNASCLYSHALELVSERAILDSVYFLNVPTRTSTEEGNSQGDSLSDSSEFSFSGDIKEFVDRLNKSLVRSGVGGTTGYTAIVDNGVISETKLFSISNQYVTDVLKSAYELYEVPYYFVGKTIHFGNQQTDILTPLQYGATNSLLSISKVNLNKQVVTRITGSGSDRNISYYYPNPTPKGKIYLESTSTTATFVVKDDMLFCSNMDLDKWVEYTGVDYVVNIDDFLASSDGYNYKSFSSSDLFSAEFQKDVWIRFTFYVENDFVDTYIDCRFDTIDRGERPLSELYVDSVLMGKDGVMPTDFIDGMVNCGKLSKASYTITLHLRYGYAGSPSYDGYFKIKNLNKAYWRVEDTGKYFDINKASIYISSGVPKHGDKIKQTLEYRIDVKDNLMPSEYRRTLGRNRWYNATNSANRGEWYGDVTFNTEYDNKHPLEYIHTDEEIYPTIKGVKNAKGESIDTFLDIAFDRDDNNEIYPEDYEDEKLAGKYKHPYFFVKLKKTDGVNGFNLFDHAIENETMKISFTTGHVAGCEFEIGVDEDTQKNPVQVDANGDLVRDKDWNIVTMGEYIDSQQDTQNNEVWLALKKEDSTMGVMMPDSASGLVPIGDLLPTGDKREDGGDTFVILGIQLPDAYITAAEDKLEKVLIEYLADNNEEKFSFSAKFSSIYLAENPKIASEINENCRVRIIYNGKTYTMYTTSCSITVKDGVALPEVAVNIDNELKVVKPKVKDVSTIITATENKIKEVENSSLSIRAQATSANNSAKDNTEKIRQLQKDKVSEIDLKDLKYNINGQTGTYNAIAGADMPPFYAASEVGRKGQILQSTGVGAPQWVSMSDIESAVGFAKDLTGVLEATQEEFTFRPSAGDKSIRDESAVIRRIKGNTNVWEQKLKTPEDGGWTAYVPDNLTINISGNEIKATLNSGVTITNPFQAGINVNIPAGSIAGHKYLFCALVMVSHIAVNNSNNSFSFEHDNTTRTLTPYISSTNNWTLVHGIWESQSNNDRSSRIKPPWSYTAANEGDWFAVKNAMFFDLTLIFGAGNEPPTYEDFKKVYSDSYFPYCEPELRTMRIASIETIGFNQFDKNSSVVGVLTSTGSIDNTSSFSKKYFTARFNVLPNTTYYLLNVANFYHIRSYVFYDAFGNVISWGGLQADSSANNASGVVTTPKDAAYMGVVVHETFIDKCCINLSHSGVRNGEYHPYKKNTLALPEVIKYFPEGMNSIGDTYDEINVDNAIQRCGIRQYADGDENNSDVRTDKVKTVFILDNPITNPILEPLQLAFDVEDFGTEQTISNQPSSPFRADIVYQFNAEGRIRDNGRNIARLETKVNTLDRATTVVSGRFDSGYVKAEGIIDAAENLYLLPSSSSTEKDKRLANEQYVIDSLPREVAQVLERRVGDIPQHLSPNILYEFVGSTTSLTIVSFNGQDDDYEDVWRVRCGLGRDVAIDILPTILWESGIAPNPTEWGIYEFEFRKTASMDGNRILGKFKVYK
jgi:hypothetical protein